MNGTLRLALDAAFIFLNLMFLYVNYNVFRKLNVREAGLEEYASDLDSWDTALKTREVQVNGIIRSDERLKGMRDRLT